MTMGSIVGNANLITKVYMPKYGDTRQGEKGGAHSLRIFD